MCINLGGAKERGGNKTGGGEIDSERYGTHNKIDVTSGSRVDSPKDVSTGKYGFENTLRLPNTSRRGVE
jgi:hypothetical protein